MRKNYKKKTQLMNNELILVGAKMLPTLQNFDP